MNKILIIILALITLSSCGRYIQPQDAEIIDQGVTTTNLILNGSSNVYDFTVYRIN
jgi:hypothetical protein